MELRKTFLVSLLISFLLNLAVFGFLIRFKPVRPKKSSVITVSLEEIPSKQPLKTEKPSGKVSSHKSSCGKSSAYKEERSVFRKKTVENVKRVKSHKQTKRRIKHKRETEKVTPQESVKETKRLNRQKALKPEEKTQNRPAVRKSFSGITEKSLKPESFYKAEEALKREGGSSLPLHRGKTAVEKTESEVLRSLASGGLAGAPQKTKESGDSKAAQKEREDYLKLVLQEIEKNKFYPLIARRMGIEGRVKLKIVIGKGGELLSVSVLSSDSSVLKRTAVKTLKKCHFPPPPGGKFETELTIRYRLE